jgi:hypothetical protein
MPPKWLEMKRAQKPMPGERTVFEPELVAMDQADRKK